MIILKKNSGKKLVIRQGSVYTIAKFRTSAYTFPIEKGRWRSIPRYQRLCPLCLGNLTGDEKHHIFHCTIDKLVDIRKDFVKE